MKVALATLGGIGDTLMLTMPAKRLKELNSGIEIVAYVSERTKHVLRFNPLFSEIRTKHNWSDAPIYNSEFDVVIDFRYGVKSFFLNNDNPVRFDMHISKINKIQKKYELDLWVADIPNYRMKNWQLFLENSEFHKRGMNWYEITSYLSGLKYSPKDLSIPCELPNITLPERYIAVSMPCALKRGYSKLYPPDYWEAVFTTLSTTQFILLGDVSNKILKFDNVHHLEGKLNINQTAHILRNADFLVSEEGGLVHVAKAVGCKAIVFFGPTQKWFFGYKDNINISFDNPKCQFCHNQKPFWINRCQYDDKSVYCKSIINITPDVIISEIEKLKSANFKKTKEVFYPDKTNYVITNKEYSIIPQGVKLTKNEENAIVETYNDEHFNSQPWQKDRMDRIVGLCVNEGPGKKILDVGCADGYLSNRLVQMGYKVTPLDLSPTRIERMRSIYNIDGVVGDIQKLPFADESFDIVIAGEIFEHLEDIHVGLREIERVVIKKGLLIVTVPIGEEHDNFALHKWAIRKQDVFYMGRPDMMVISLRRINRDE